MKPRRKWKLEYEVKKIGVLLHGHEYTIWIMIRLNPFFFFVPISMLRNSKKPVVSIQIECRELLYYIQWDIWTFPILHVGYGFSYDLGRTLKMNNDGQDCINAFQNMPFISTVFPWITKAFLSTQSLFHRLNIDLQPFYKDEMITKHDTVPVCNQNLFC